MQKHPGNDHRKGFALITTLSLMVLLALIAVGLLTLSTATVRTSSKGEAMATARSNARLALVLAIGELQKELGPDQRISARAEILDKEPATAEIEGVANPNYLGVWDSWNTWLTDQRGSLSIQDTYKRGRDTSLFRSWLVSNRNAGDYQSALTEAPSTDSVLLVGQGSAGEDLEKHIRAERIPVTSNSSKGGTYAWWVSDEAQKARLNLMPRDEADSAEEAATLASHTGRMGVETMTEMGDFDTSPESLPKMITTGQAGISAPGAVEHFHNMTSSSMGLLTDCGLYPPARHAPPDLDYRHQDREQPASARQQRLFHPGHPCRLSLEPLRHRPLCRFRGDFLLRVDVLCCRHGAAVGFTHRQRGWEPFS